MPLSLEDLMNFMKNDKEERNKERERDKKELKELISQGVKDEVATALKPMQQRQSHLETVQSDMMEEFKGVIKEVREMKNNLQSSRADQFPSLPSQSKPPGHGLVPPRPYSQQRVNTESAASAIGGTLENVQVMEIVSLGRRTVGLDKIDSEDLERMRQPQYGGAQTEMEEKLLAVQEFLRCELKMDNDLLKSMEIEEIFAPYKENSKHLFVTFKHESSVSRIYERTRIMRKGSRILNFTPRQFRDRGQAIRQIEYQVRTGEKCQTRIKMGLGDLELWKKFRGVGHRWERVTLPNNLPAVDLSIPVANFESLSPPPGRPTSFKRGRESTGSESAQINPKVLRQEADEEKDGTEDGKLIKDIESAILVGEATITPTKEGEGLKKKLDPGFVHSVVGTPSSSSYQDSPSSPILHRSARK